MKSAKYDYLNIITPTLNEEANIKKLIVLIHKLYPGSHISVADDGSKDKTQEIVRNLARKDKTIHLIDRSKVRVKGLTASVVDGILSTKQPFFIVIDADLQHPPEKIRNIYTLLHRYDLVIGIRKKVKSDWPLHRKLISKSAIWVGNLRLLIAGKYYKDIVSGFFGGRTKLIQKVIKKHYRKFELPGYKVLFDILKYTPRRTRVSYVKYIFGLRKEGTSKLGNKQIISYIKSIFK